MLNRIHQIPLMAPKRSLTNAITYALAEGAELIGEKLRFQEGRVRMSLTTGLTKSSYISSV